MHHVLAAVLLFGAVGGAVLRPWRLPAWFVPAIAAAITLLVQNLSLRDARLTLRLLSAPLAFVLVAVPLAVMLDRVGIFEELAGHAARSPRVVGSCWVLSGFVVALLNLDAAVVLLTPLYIRTARKVGLDPVMMAFQPVLLAMLASSALPVSNLTNLVAASRFSLTNTDFLSNITLPAALASTVGWFVYRRIFPAHATIGLPPGAADRRALAVGGSAIGLFVLLLVGGDHLGIPAWVAGAVTIGFLALFTRSVPWRRAPLGTVVLASTLAIVAASAASAYPHVLGGAGDGGVRGFLTGVASADVLNNLPATIVTLPHVTHVPNVWALLFGLNIGPTLVITGSLAGLLWQASAGASGVHVTAGQYSRVGAMVGVPAMVIGVLALSLR